jgi:taurine dioxygenase
MECKRVSGALGGLITGVDLTAPLSAAVLGDLKQALLEHQVLFFRNQALSPEQHMALATAFGGAAVP